jgi:hypothetical protein
MSFRRLAYLVAFLCWLGMIYVSAHTGEGSTIVLVGTLALGGLTLLVLDSIGLIGRK